MTKMFKLFLVLALSVGLGGCGLFAKPASESEIKLIDNSKNKEGYWYQYDVGRRGAFLIDRSKLLNGNIIMCAEPSPDVAVDAGVSAGFKNDSVGLNTDSMELKGRTETVLVLREAMYRLCELSANHNNLSNDDLKDMFESILAQASKVANAELDHVNAAKKQADLDLKNAQVALDKANTVKATADKEKK